MTDWITGPPSPDQVAEHGKRGGLWNICGETFVIIQRVTLEGVNFGDASRLRFFPVGEDGLPVDYAALRKVEETAVRLVAKLDSLDAGCDGTTMPQIASLRAALKELEG